MRIHLDTLGGMAGDMFIAAVLDAFPEQEAAMLRAIGTVAPPETGCRLLEHSDGLFRGRRFEVRGPASPPPASHHEHHEHHEHQEHHEHHEHGSDDHKHHPHSHAHDHHEHEGEHTRWSTIRGRLMQADLSAATREHAIAIFSHLAEAEGRVHGVPPEEVTFHVVGAWDSIADIVGAAQLISGVAARGEVQWSVSALPLGSGRVRTAHGLMPVPAPATVELLRGFDFVDDGAPGERVTPTGGAILRHLCDPGKARTQTAARAGGVLSRTGVGFGARLLPGLSNCVRLLVFEGADASVPSAHRELLVVEFEVDDQSAEDLATGLDRLRAHPAVFDAVQSPVFGKKGRMMTHVRLLARSDALDAVAEAVFRETTTIGLRHHHVRGKALARQAVEVELGARRVRVKTVERPGGERTAKTEADDALAHETHAGRAALRREGERLALALDPKVSS